MLKIALPNKGRLAAPAVELFRKAGVGPKDVDGSRLLSKSPEGDLEFLFLRAYDIPEYVSDGVVDLGVTGWDLVQEKQASVAKLLNLGFGTCRLVVAVPADSGVKSPKELKQGAKVATVFPYLSKKYFKKLGKKVEIVEVSGATEITPYLGVADAVVDLSASGSTLAVNKLEIIDSILDSEACLVANKKSLGKQKERLSGIKELLESVLRAEGKKYLMANVPQRSLEAAKKAAPGMEGPTIMQILGKEKMYAIQVVVDSDKIFKTIRDLKRAGARDILVTPIERIIP